MSDCARCGHDPCTCMSTKKPARDHADSLRMQSGNVLPRCTWIILERCALPVAGTMLGQPPLCSWHRAWFEQLGTAKQLEERIERPAFDHWWDDREATYHYSKLWGLSKEEYWRYAHGQRIHDPKPETLPSIQEPPAYLTKEEFGVDLFEAIRLQSGIRQLERKARVWTAKGLTPIKADEMRLRTLHTHLKTILEKNTIATPDLKRLMAMQ